MSMSQYGEDLSDIDPTTGATRRKDKHNNNRSQVDNKMESDDDVDNESEVMSGGQGSKYETKETPGEKWAEKCQPVKQEG
jgi:hypothetical protein